MMAWANSFVLADPPMSPVRTLAVLIAPSIADRSFCARSCRPTCSSIRPAQQDGDRIGDALARDVRAPSRAPPRRSRRSRRCWRPAPCRARRPGPAIWSERMSPNRLVVTIMSNCHGLSTSCMAHASTMRSSISTRPSYCFATSRPLEEDAGQRLQHVGLVDDGDLLAAVPDARSRRRTRTMRRDARPGVDAGRDRDGVRVVADRDVVLEADVQPLEVLADQHDVDVLVAAARA